MFKLDLQLFKAFKASESGFFGEQVFSLSSEKKLFSLKRLGLG